MALTAQQIVNDIEAHLAKSTARYFSDFYIGITNDINRRLFSEHNVARNGHWYIYREALNDKYARSVENHYIQKGMKGGDGGGNHISTFVYCYEISSSTNE